MNPVFEAQMRVNFRKLVKEDGLLFACRFLEEMINTCNVLTEVIEEESNNATGGKKL